jgi:hypothetical protein
LLNQADFFFDLVTFARDEEKVHFYQFEFDDRSIVYNAWTVNTFIWSSSSTF